MELAGLFLRSNGNAGAGAGEKEQRLGSWFRRRLNLSTEQVISGLFSTLDWVSDGALAFQTSQNINGGYRPTDDQTMGCLNELIRTAQISIDDTTTAAQLTWADSSVALTDGASFGMSCLIADGSSCAMAAAYEAALHECTRKRALSTADWVPWVLWGGALVGFCTDCFKTYVLMRIGAKERERTAVEEVTEAWEDGPKAAEPKMSDKDRGSNKHEANELAKKHGRIGALGLLFEDVPQLVAVAHLELVDRPAAIPGGAGFSRLAAFSVTGTLLQLAWKGWVSYKASTKAAFHELMGNPNLNTELDIALHDAKLNDEELSAVCVTLGRLSNMNARTLRWGGIVGEGADANKFLKQFATIAQPNLSELRRRDLTGNHIGDSGAAAIGEGLKHCSKLQTLW
eukprot:COSAG02_NODE_3967_length_5975_cov_20.818244_2_plen_399_part_00